MRQVPAAATLVALLFVTVSVGGSAAAGSTRTTAKKGGVYRVAFEHSFGFTDSFDPTGEYCTYSFNIFSNLMIRTLVGYDHVAGPAGNKLVPDIATSVPKPTDGGKTYTFHLKQGVKFGPPVSRAVTSKDVLYALERLAKPKNGAEYGFYYTPIVGLEAYGAGKAKTIAGIQTPNAGTIVFHLTKPVGDFLYRLAMPATGPMPKEVAGCFDGQAGRYGRDVVSTGPYMIAGADKVNVSSCSAIKPMSGYDGVSSLKLVRNPDYDPATDSPAARQSFPDEFDFTVNANPNDIVDRVAAGELTTRMPPACRRTPSRATHGTRPSGGTST